MPGGWIGIVLILCALLLPFSTSVDAGTGSHIDQPVGEAMRAVERSGAGGQLHRAADLLAVGLALLAPVVLIVLWRRDVIRWGSLRRRGARDVSAWPWWFWLLCAFGTLLASGIGAGAAGGFAAGLLADPPDLTLQAFMVVGGGLAGAGTSLLLALVAQERTLNPDAAGISMRVNARVVWLGVLAFVLAMPVVQAASIGAVLLFRMVTGSDPDLIAHDTLQALHREPGNPAVWALVLGAVLLAPILEELAFRVFLQSAIMRIYRGGAWLSIIVASLIFAGAHVGAGIGADQWHAIITLFVLGVALGLAYEWTRRPMVPIVMHMIFNAFNIALVALGTA
jgi:membrane protease YdiL (CAAX protease family)